MSWPANRPDLESVSSNNESTVKSSVQGRRLRFGRLCRRNEMDGI